MRCAIQLMYEVHLFVRPSHTTICETTSLLRDVSQAQSVKD